MTKKLKQFSGERIQGGKNVCFPTSFLILFCFWFFKIQKKNESILLFLFHEPCSNTEIVQIVSHFIFPIIVQIVSHISSWIQLKNPPANAGDIRDIDSIPLSGRFPGGGHSNPLQYSCLKNPMDRGAWRAVVHRVSKRWTQLKWLSKQAQATKMKIKNKQRYYQR